MDAGILGAALLLIAFLAVIVDAEARRRGRTDPRWRRVGRILHATITVALVGVLGGIALLVLVLAVFRPIGGP